jgi:hypothetical protein
MANMFDTNQARPLAGESPPTRKLSPRAADLLADRQGPLPVWIRAPKFGPEYFTGFTRAKLYQEAAKGNIRSVSIRDPGQVKGVRLFHLQSILDFIESRAQQHSSEIARNSDN